jgi:HAMP domain-containing protein
VKIIKFTLIFLFLNILVVRRLERLRELFRTVKLKKPIISNSGVMSK